MVHMISLRPPQMSELELATELCLRSKAYWGYDTEFMSACVAELTLSREDLLRDEIILAFQEFSLVGVAQVSNGNEGCFLEKLFVDPFTMGKGVGRKLFDWSISVACRQGAEEIIVEADPGAVPFYYAMLCKEAGTVQSGSIPSRRLPRLIRKVHAI